MKPSGTFLAIPVLVLVAACGATAANKTSDAPAAASRDTMIRPGTSPEAGSPPETDMDTLKAAVGDSAGTDGAQGVQQTALQTRAVISKGQVSLESDDLDKARFELQKLLDTWNGTITNEQSSADEEGRTDRQRLEIRVPSTVFGTAMDGISKLGKLVDRSRTSEDVTTQVIDNDARVRSQKLSLARVQALLAKAKDLNQIIAIEDQLSQRQAELDSLEQQQKYLADQTTQATISLYLTASRPDRPSSDDDGFTAGLTAGWDHLGSATSAVLEGVGAALPFTAVVALVALPGWLIWRRRRPLA